MAQASMAANPALKETYVQLKTRMDKAVEDFRREMAATRTGRANVHMLDTVPSITTAPRCHSTRSRQFTRPSRR